MRPPLGVYLHVPYCATICSYCDFVKYVAGDRAGWAAAAIGELRLAAPLLDRPADTVFFGGGTPTLIAPDDLGAVLREIDLAPGAEVTVEANPDSVDERSLAALLEAGVTRISLGMQSAVPHVLEMLGRVHEPDRPLAAAREARAAGFEQVGMDLIYGAPNETAEDWSRSLDAALSVDPDHVSAYGLDVVPGTRLFADIRAGRIPTLDQDALAERYLVAEERLTAAGLHWYEVSNWARDEAARCRHNVGYWSGGEWVGIGPGAHSAIGGRRWWNVRHPDRWAELVAEGRLPEKGAEDLDPRQRDIERLMLAVRTRAGVRTEHAEAATLAADGLLDLDDGHAVLTLRGRLLADHVTRRLTG